MSRSIHILTGVGIVAGALSIAETASAADLGQLIKLLARQNQASAKSQDASSKLDDEARRLERDFEATARQADSLELYVQQLEASVKGQEERIESLESQIERVVDVGRRTVPLMRRMVSTLEELVKIDVPFLLDERQTRVDRLKGLLDDPSVTDAEKYRIIMEAYQVEMEYGRTIEAYQGRLTEDGSREDEGEGAEDKGGKVVSFLRFGRVVLAYESLDKNEYGVWNQKEGRWDSLDKATFGAGISRALQIARKQVAPDLVLLPVQETTTEDEG